MALNTQNWRQYGGHDHSKSGKIKVNGSPLHTFQIYVCVSVCVCPLPEITELKKTLICGIKFTLILEWHSLRCRTWCSPCSCFDHTGAYIRTLSHFRIFFFYLLHCTVTGWKPVAHKLLMTVLSTCIHLNNRWSNYLWKITKLLLTFYFHIIKC